MIQVGDIVIVSLGGGGVLVDAEVIVIPGNNQIYWEFLTPDGETHVVGPSMIDIRKPL